jgi:cell division protein FtsW
MWKTTTALIGIVLLLLTLGVVMLASASSVQGDSLWANPYLSRQLGALAVGLLVAVVASRVDYRRWKSLAPLMGLLTVLLLLLVLTPGIGKSVKGSQRWLPLGPFGSIQPSELAKLALVLVMGWWMSRVQRKAHNFWPGLAAPLLMMGALAGLVFAEPDFGTTMLMGSVGMVIMFAGGARLSYLAIAGALGFSAISLAIMQDAERMRRIVAFLHPELYAKDEAFQLLNAIYAFVVGGAGGSGLGGSLQKRYYLPEAHTDFIFAIGGEEMGLFLSLGVAALFLSFFLCGVRISFRAVDSFGRLVAFGITSMITLQAAINIGVVTGCLPTKGLPLPFVSYGGTSMVVTLLMVGVLVNIALQSGGEKDDDGLAVVRDRVRRI